MNPIVILKAIEMIREAQRTCHLPVSLTEVTKLHLKDNKKKLLLFAITSEPMVF